MLALSFSIIFTTALGIWFKEAQRRSLPLQAIIFLNYLTCVILGSLFSPDGSTVTFVQSSALMFVIPQGALLITNFYLLGFTCQRAGLGVAAFASRSGVLVPAALSFFLFGEEPSLTKGLGIFGTAAALWLVLCERKVPPGTASRGGGWLAGATFMGYGTYFLLLKWVQSGWLPRELQHAYVAFCFGLAALLSLVPLLRRGARPTRMELLWGIGLGCSNYGSVYLVLYALGLPGYQATFVLPTFAMGTVTLSSLAGKFVYGERFSRRKVIGVLMVLASIPLLF